MKVIFNLASFKHQIHKSVVNLFHSAVARRPLCEGNRVSVSKDFSLYAFFVARCQALASAYRSGRHGFSLLARVSTGSEFLSESVVELFHGDLAIAVVVEAPHERVLLVVGYVNAETKKS